MKLTVKLERMRGLESATYCTLFPPKEDEIVKEMQDAGRAHNDLTHQKRKEEAHMSGSSTQW